MKRKSQTNVSFRNTVNTVRVNRCATVSGVDRSGVSLGLETRESLVLPPKGFLADEGTNVSHPGQLQL